MRIRALAVAVALVAGSAAAVSAAPAAKAPDRTSGTAPARAGGHAPLGFHRDDFRSAATLRAARLRVIAEHAKLARLGLASTAGQQPVWGWGNSESALPDIDGDGVGDVLSARLFARTPALKVLSGRTGRTLWSVPSATNTLAAVYVPAPNGKSVMVVLSETDTGQETPVGGGQVDAFTVSAVNPKTGAAQWSTTVTGVIEDDPTDAVFAGLGELDGVLMRKNTTPYLLLDRYVVDFGAATVTTSVTPMAIDATNGNVVHPGAPLGGDGYTFATPVGDLDGDGVDDYLVCASGDAPAIGARSGTTGQPIWTTDSTSNSFLISLATSPDLSGDHKQDLLLGWFGDSGPTVDAVNGSTGANVWTAAGDYGVPIGDIDHDGRSDTRVVVDGARITLSAMSGTGRRLWSRDILSPSGTRGLVWDAGDLDGDHADDAYIEFASAKPNTPAKSGDIVGGRTGASRAVPDLGWALGVSLRGGAPSFVRGVAAKKGFALTAFDGRTDRALWRTVVNASDVQQVAMLDEVSLGHGHVGLLALLMGRFSDTVVLLDGRHGTTLWKTTYDTPGDEGGFVI
jgi:hypothetical protein